jgi:sugar O-acyltransferase (sialic acid O-acetyltransferase NeuD family)
MKQLFIYGTGGFARQLLEPLLASQEAGGDEKAVFEAIMFLDDNAGITDLFGLRVARLSDAPQSNAFLVAIGDGNARRSLTERCKDHGLISHHFYADTAKIARHARVGEGAILLDFAVIESGARIGKGFQGNVSSFVAHDCVVGDYVTFGPYACCNGNVHIGDFAYIGAGAIIKQGTPNEPLRIGKGAIIGMGAVVTKDVPDGAVVVGNPARIRD